MNDSADLLADLQQSLQAFEEHLAQVEILLNQDPHDAEAQQVSISMQNSIRSKCLQFTEADALSTGTYKAGAGVPQKTKVLKQLSAVPCRCSRS